jgi:hypothetical protein
MKLKLKDKTSKEIFFAQSSDPARWIVRRDLLDTRAISRTESEKYRIRSGTVGEIDFADGRIFLFDQATETFWETELA